MLRLQVEISNPPGRRPNRRIELEPTAGGVEGQDEHPLLAPEFGADDEPI
jgi:hypothetical protein